MSPALSKRLVPLVLAAAGALTLVSGCGSSSGKGGSFPTGGSSVAPVDSTSTAPATSSAPAAAAKLDACALLTKTEAEAVAGTPLDDAVPAGAAGSGDATLCQYTGPTTGPTAQVEVYVGDGAKKQLDIERDTLGHPFTTVAGVGDECVQEENFIFVRKGTQWASVHLVRLNDPAENVQPLQTAIKQVADRLS